MTKKAASQPLHLRAMGSFHVGGRHVQLSGKSCYQRTMSDGGEPVSINPNGSYVVEQMYVQYFLPEHPNGKGPLIFWHGGGMTGATWETKPDGTDGWLNFFIRHGWDVYVCDAVERGRSGFAPFPDIWPEGPIVQTVNDVYSRFRIGQGEDSYHHDPALRRNYPNTRFPVAHFDTFSQQMVPRWTHTNQAMIRAFQALLERIGPASIICHSQSGPLAIKLAATHQDKVRALVAVEPAGVPAEIKHYSVPTLAVMGGNMANDLRWQSLRQKLSAFVEQHACVKILDLETLGVLGNSHVLMMDNNSDDIAQHLQTWLLNVLPS